MALFLFSTCSPVEIDPQKPHHTSRGFRNVHAYEKRGRFAFWKWQWQRIAKELPSAEEYTFPVAENDPAFLQKNRTQTTVTWVGHATLLLQLEGINILTDPHFTERASPVSWAGPKRLVAPGLSLDDLPVIDIVVISHNHHDSLDLETVKRLHQRRGGEETLFFVPLKLKPWFTKLGITNVIELDWWQSHEVGKLKVVALPVQHWSRRTLLDTNKTLWAAWGIVTPEFRFLFAGDSGYTPHFRDIGARYGPFDLAAIPIGAYEPRWFMKASHVNPEEAVQVHQDLQAKFSVAIHWGTFILTDEPLDEPPKELASALKQAGISPQEFMVFQHGQTHIFADKN